MLEKSCKTSSTQRRDLYVSSVCHSPLRGTSRSILAEKGKPAKRTLPRVWVELPSLSGTVGAGTGCHSGQETIAYTGTNRRGDSGVSGPSPWVIALGIRRLHGWAGERGRNKAAEYSDPPSGVESQADRGISHAAN